MITMKKSGATLGIDPTEFYGLSTDEKPTKANSACSIFDTIESLNADVVSVPVEEGYEIVG
jgi:hypothetical protein